MNNNQLITCDDNEAVGTPELIHFFSLQNTSHFWSAEALRYHDFLEKLVFQISRKPKHLLAHVQRIYYCFHMDLNEQLFAALVDFLVILNRQGREISRRMVMGAKSHLNSAQFKILNDYLRDDYLDVQPLSGNQFSILTKGLIGVSDIIQHITSPDEHQHDPLDLALDYIQYSQLDEAQQVLEKAILEQPARLDLHHELLAIYKSTHNTAGFNQMLAELVQSGIAVPDEWSQLNSYFKGKK
jgi:hypothetical protein